MGSGKEPLLSKPPLSASLGGARVLLPTLAWGYTPVPGLGRVYNGMLLPVLALAALIAPPGLDVLIGRHGVARTRTRRWVC